MPVPAKPAIKASAPPSERDGAKNVRTIMAKIVKESMSIEIVWLFVSITTLFFKRTHRMPSHQ